MNSIDLCHNYCLSTSMIVLNSRCCKVVVRSAKNPEAIHFHSDLELGHFSSDETQSRTNS